MSMILLFIVTIALASALCATTYTFSGKYNMTLEGKLLFGGDKAGEEKVTATQGISLTPSTAPTITGFLKGTFSVSGGTDLLLAHATDPLQGAGDAQYSSGFTVAGSKIKLLYIEVLTGAILTVARASSNGLTLLSAASDAIPLTIGDILQIYRKAGGDALTTGSNDALTLTPSAGTITGTIVVLYGS